MAEAIAEQERVTATAVVDNVVVVAAVVLIAMGSKVRVGAVTVAVMAAVSVAAMAAVALAAMAVAVFASMEVAVMAAVSVAAMAAVAAVGNQVAVVAVVAAVVAVVVAIRALLAAGMVVVEVVVAVVREGRKATEEETGVGQGMALGASALVADMVAAVMALEGLVATWVMALEAAVSEATTEGTEVVAPRELAAARLLERKQPSRQRSGNVPCRHSSAA